jgi:hypothetical protein
MHDLAVQRAGPDSICAQLAGFGLLPEAAGTIDLSNPGPVLVMPPARRKGRRTRWPTGEPVLLGTASEDGRQLVVWCPFEHRNHYHSRHGAIEGCGPGCPCALHADLHGRHGCDCPAGSGDGRRHAHCTEDTPFRRGGYWIREVAR